MSSAHFGDEADLIDMHIEVSFSRLDPPEGRAARVSRSDEPSGVGAQEFVGWLGLLGVLQRLTGDDVEPNQL